MRIQPKVKSLARKLCHARETQPATADEQDNSVSVYDKVRRLTLPRENRTLRPHYE